jgi:signal transduction histidine kinase
LDGNLPEDAMTGQLLVEIIREAVTNAVRHGFATQVHIEVESLMDCYHMKITDNGYPVSDNISEGGGLSSIRKKLEFYGGTLTITTYPGFALSVEVPA